MSIYLAQRKSWPKTNLLYPVYTDLLWQNKAGIFYIVQWQKEDTKIKTDLN